MAGNRKKEIDPARLKELAGLGLTQKEMAGVLGMSEETFYLRLREKPELTEWIQQGKAEAASEVSNALFQLCLKGNLGAIIWYEKTRRGIRDTVEIDVSKLSDDEIRGRLQQMVKEISRTGEVS
ncbi:MAG: hypothetical protein JSS66_00125 [Armatimonadetes bacterium]|nr:hypothetical protein [Armatimonadota bacterium]